MTSVDVAKAFDRVVHPAITHGLRRKGIAEDFCLYIADFYSRATTVLTCGAHTKVAHPSRFVRQRDPHSRLLFNLVLDDFFEDQPAHIAFESEGLSVSAMAFADGIILTASTRGGLQCELDSLDAYLKGRGIEANAAM
ncbi:hypothetical protein HPB52_023802 [Rhipicephalus sanguineus]|uniref:Reverse transcriptase domain-containing protein n=1 Tax=Rhipicephalus sanguineus TaxID=34632 RepID=A0A9D4T111_RHISA|nr:hypothetical protein HPB52_023802 [Rhipicephalus sanguineus]